ncbi:hypothetical protein GCM10011511_07650 [Puia dinghuensis]|uniref:SAM-dependent methyltransferase n=1 Tax=Puia dinghuensis TaxID=1792502 RepID=A0A8J2XR04_9BACT|nr:hypothetical protein GCM10011511_07650 [Puia dinghuensis]
MDGLCYRQVNEEYADDYRQLIDSGLYQALSSKNWLIGHSEVEQGPIGGPGHLKTLLPRQLPFISYPAEWSPDQLKDAALLTLGILRAAISRGMILKDASPTNIQFADGRPLFIDSLSFERYDASRPWVAYRQFCECFLYPLLLHHYHHQGVHKILAAYPEGIAASTTLPQLPLKSRLRPGIWLHVVLPARIRQGDGDAARLPPFDEKKLLLVVDNLESTIQKLRTDAPGEGSWRRYYSETILSSSYLAEKEKIFREMLGSIGFSSALDLGANDGHFSKILAERKALVIAADSDWACIGNLYRWCRDTGTSIYPLCIDIADPTPASGFGHAERSSFTERAESDLVIALALIHHLVLTRNIPFHMLAGYIARLTRAHLIVEFVAATDEKAILLTRNKPGFHKPYNANAFEQEFGRYFTIIRRTPIPGTERILYLMRKKEGQ